jgi:hypothetical protein
MTKQDRNMQQNTGGISDRQDPLQKQDRRQGNVQQDDKNYVDRQDSDIDQGQGDKMGRQGNLSDKGGKVQDTGFDKDKGFQQKR